MAPQLISRNLVNFHGICTHSCIFLAFLLKNSPPNSRITKGASPSALGFPSQGLNPGLLHGRQAPYQLSYHGLDVVSALFTKFYHETVNPNKEKRDCPHWDLNPRPMDPLPSTLPTELSWLG